MTTSNYNENMEIDLTNKYNNKGNNGVGDDFSEDSGGAENKGGDGGGRNDGGDETTPTVPPCKPNLWAGSFQEDFIPE